MAPAWRPGCWIRSPTARSQGRTPRNCSGNNDLYLFLDGLDQIPTADGQRRAFRALEEFLRRYEICHLAMTVRSDAYIALGAAADQLPLVRICPMSPAEVAAYLWNAGRSAWGLRQAVVQDKELANALNTSLFLKAGLSAFRDRDAQEIVEGHKAGHWDDVVLAEFVRLLLRQQTTSAIGPESTLRYLTWVGRVFAAAQVASFYGFVPPRRLLDEANQYPKVGGRIPHPERRADSRGRNWRGWLAAVRQMGGSRRGGAGRCWCLYHDSGDNRQDGLGNPGRQGDPVARRLARGCAQLAGSLVAAVALAGLAQFVATYQITRALRFGVMTQNAAARSRLYFAVMVVALAIWYVIRAAARAGRIVSPVEMDLPSDNRMVRPAWWLRLPDLTLACMSAAFLALLALIWATAFELLAGYEHARLRSATAQNAFRDLLRIMDFPARSPLQLEAGPLWILVVAAIGFGVGAATLWAIELFSTDWFQAASATCDRDIGLPADGLIDALDYSVQLSLLRRVEGRYSFYHPRFLEFFSKGGSGLVTFPWLPYEQR